jgi:hypothetical protein
MCVVTWRFYHGPALAPGPFPHHVRIASCLL